MHPCPCPACSHLTEPQRALSVQGLIYYCCEVCRHIWVIDKKTGRVSHVSPLPQKPPTPESDN